MHLQVRGRHLAGDFAFDDLLDDLGFLLAPRHQDDLLGAHDRVDTHRDGHLRRVFQAEERPGLDFARVVGQLNQPRARFGIRSRFVEADLPVLADADDHQVDLAHRVVVRCAVFGNPGFGYRAVGDVDIFGQDVDMVEEILVDAEIAALLFGRADRVELVEAEYRHVAEADDPLLVAFDQFAVQPERGAPGREPQHERLRLLVNLVRAVDFVIRADCLHDGVGDVLHAQVLVFINRRVDLFVTVDDVARSRYFDQAPVFGK